jgi:hypothetical protein
MVIGYTLFPQIIIEDVEKQERLTASSNARDDLYHPVVHALD